jgi:hypothetical protein
MTSKQFPGLKHWLIATATILGLGNTTLSTSVAAEAQPPMMVQVRTSIIKPGMNARYEEFVQQLNGLRAKHGTPQGHFIQQARTGELAYYTVTPFQQFSEMQGVNWRATFGEREAAKLMTMISESVETTSLALYMSRPDLGRPSDQPPGEYEVFWTYLIKVKQNAGAAYEEALAKVVEASAKVAPDLHWLAYAPGPSASRYRVVAPLMWADLETSPMPIPERLVRAFGESEGMKWNRQLTEATEDVEIRLTLNRMDLAYQPAE